VRATGRPTTATLRSGYLPGSPDPARLTRAWGARLDGAVYGQPLVVGERVLVATEADSLYALELRSGAVRWRTSVGRSVPLSELPCVNIDPLGITGTPVYDPATGLVFAVAEVTGPAHLLVGVDAGSGRPCTDGLRQIRAGPGARLEPGWQAPAGVSGSPVVGGHTVYSLDPAGGILYALDADQGSVRASAPVGQTSRFATPTLARRAGAGRHPDRRRRAPPPTVAADPRPAPRTVAW
jgi:outer membrane protein assembly factor BamB